jgi:ornithine carbamoyltransferase
MTISFTMRVSVPQNILVRTFENESVLLNLETESYHGLDEVGTGMWQALTQSENIQKAYESLLSDYQVDEATLRQDLQAFLQDLVTRGLVELSGS